MLDGLLGRGGFSSKCKSLIKPTKTRIEVIRRRAEAQHRFLKEDLVKLLSNGLDINAYGRVVEQTEEFLAGLNLLSCYNFLEKACEYIYKQLSVMQKQSGCPEECREAVASLMFAAARFSDLPELRDLRDVFQERYGNALECFANQVFVEKLASKPPTKEKRLQLLQDIASEYSIKWDSKGFQQRMANPSVPTQEKSTKHGPSTVSDGKYKLPNSKDVASLRSKERIEHASHAPTLDNGRGNGILRREELNLPFVGKQEIPATIKAETSLRGENHEIPFRGRQNFIAEKHGSLKGKDDNVLKMETSGSSSVSRRSEYSVNDMVNADQLRENANTASPAPARVTVKGACNDYPIQTNLVKSTGKVQELEADKLKFHYNNALPPPYVKVKDNSIPPPYVKPKEGSYGAHDRSKHSRMDTNGSSVDPSPRIQTKPAISSDRVSRSPDHHFLKEDGPKIDRDYLSHGGRKGSKHADNSPCTRDGIQNEPDNSHNEDHDHAKYLNDQNNIPLPKPRSIRRKHSKSSSSHDEVGSSEDARIVKRISSSKRKEKQGLQILVDDEEKMMDKLLLHYSKKSSTYDVEKLRKKPQPHNVASPRVRSRDGPSENPELVIAPNRSRSLPHEQSGESDAPKIFARANSFQPDNQAKHVHPKLPDYDDLAARFAALKGL